MGEPTPFLVLFGPPLYVCVVTVPLASSRLTVLSTSVNSSNASCDKNMDARLMCCDHSGWYCRSPRKPLKKHQTGQHSSTAMNDRRGGGEPLWEHVSLCWGRRADHVGTPSEGSCSLQGGGALLTTDRHGPRPLSLPLWLEWPLRLLQWPPPPLLCCIKILAAINAGKMESSIDTLRVPHEVPQVVWIGHAMCDDGALQCNHRFVFSQSLWYQWMNPEEGV